MIDRDGRPLNVGDRVRDWGRSSGEMVGTVIALDPPYHVTVDFEGGTPLDSPGRHAWLAGYLKVINVVDGLAELA